MWFTHQLNERPALELRLVCPDGISICSESIFFFLFCQNGAPSPLGPCTVVQGGDMIWTPQFRGSPASSYSESRRVPLWRSLVGSRKGYSKE